MSVYGAKHVIEKKCCYFSYENYEASIGFPAVYDYHQCKFETEQSLILNNATMAELDERGHFLQFMVICYICRSIHKKLVV
jgi:hypothetical protein